MAVKVKGITHRLSDRVIAKKTMLKFLLTKDKKVVLNLKFIFKFEFFSFYLPFFIIGFSLIINSELICVTIVT
jgi:hypothetical protein